MIKIKNTLDKEISVPNFPTFQPGEIREVEEKDAEYLKNSPFLEEVEALEDLKESKKGVK
jgi:hypothetical protein